MIYMDNAATTLHKPDAVKEAVLAAFDTMGNAGRGASEPALDASRVIYATREKLAHFFNAESASRIVFTANSTESLNIAIKGLFCSGDHVITTVLEHNSVLRPLYECQEHGVEVSILGCDEKGNISYDEMEREVKSNTKAVVCTHASNLTGNMIDLDRVAKIVKKHELLLIVDASQTAGCMAHRCSENRDRCPLFHRTQRTARTPGNRRDVCEDRCRDPSTSLRRERNRYLQSASSVTDADGSGSRNAERARDRRSQGSSLVSGRDRTGCDPEKEQSLMWRFYKGISRISGIKVYGDFSTRKRAAIVSFNIGDYDSSEVSDELNMEYGIVTRPGAHCAPLMHRALGTVEQGAVRFSFCHYNTEEEVDTAIRAVEELAQE